MSNARVFFLKKTMENCEITTVVFHYFTFVFLIARAKFHLVGAVLVAWACTFTKVLSVFFFSNMDKQVPVDFSSIPTRVCVGCCIGRLFQPGLAFFFSLIDRSVCSYEGLGDGGSWGYSSRWKARSTSVTFASLLDATSSTSSSSSAVAGPWSGA